MVSPISARQIPVVAGTDAPAVAASPAVMTVLGILSRQKLKWRGGNTANRKERADA
jgi:hypothetical protein